VWSFNGAISKVTIALGSPIKKSGGWRGDFKFTLFVFKFNSWTRRICPAFRITFGRFFRVAGAGNAFFRPPFFGFTSFFGLKKSKRVQKNIQSLYRAKKNGQKSVCEQSVNLRALRNVFPF